MAHRALLLGRNDGQGLQWCCRYEPDNGDRDGLGACDVRRMRDALVGHGYRVEVVPSHCREEEDVSKMLKLALEGCDADDDFLFYFSGHLRADADAPQLVLEASATPKLISLRWIIELLQVRYKVRKTYVILDCCQADRVREVWKPDEKLAIRVLVATHSLTPAKQLARLQGSLFTHCLCEALQDPEHWDPHADGALVDDDGGIRSERLSHWLAERIAAVWSKHKGDGPAPVPRAYGGRRGEPFLVARVDLHTGWPLDLRNNLYRALKTLEPDLDKVLGAYQHCRALAAGHPDLKSCPDGADRRWMLGQLLAAGHYCESSGLRLPLFTFVTRLACELGEPPLLWGWLEEARRWLEATCRIDAQVIAAAAAPRPQPARNVQPDPYLMVRLEPDLTSPDEGMLISWDFYPDSDRLDTSKHGLPVSVRADHASLAAAVARAANTLIGCVHTPRIEVLLPFALLIDDGFVDALERRLSQSQSTGDASAAVTAVRLRPRHLAFDCPLVLRCRERWIPRKRGEDYGGAPLRDHWALHRPCLQAPATAPCLDRLVRKQGQTWAEAALARLVRPRGQRAALALLSPEPIPDRDAFRELLETGLPILLWPRRRAAEPPLLNALDTEVAGGDIDVTLADLPAALHRHRRLQALAESPPVCDFSLLWDDPDRPLLHAMLTPFGTDTFG